MSCSSKILKSLLRAKPSGAYSQKDPWNFATSVCDSRDLLNFVLLNHNSGHIRRSLCETVRRSIYLPLSCHHRSGGVEIIPSACACILIPAGDHISTFVKPVPDSALYATVHFAVPSAVHTGSNGTPMLRFSGAISTQSQITSLSS